MNVRFMNEKEEEGLLLISRVLEIKKNTSNVTAIHFILLTLDDGIKQK